MTNPRCPVFHPSPGSASSHCGRIPALSSPSPEEGPWSRKFCAIGLACHSSVQLRLHPHPASLVSVSSYTPADTELPFPGLCLGLCTCHRKRMNANEQVNASYSERWVFVKFWLYYLRLGTGKLSFQLTNLFCSPSWACAGSSPNPIPFLDLPVSLTQFGLFPGQIPPLYGHNLGSYCT